MGSTRPSKPFTPPARVGEPVLSPLDRYGGRGREIVEAMMEVVLERGYADTSVKQVAAKAGVSTRTFYRFFGDLDDCMTIVLEMGLEYPRALIVDAFSEHEHWEDGVRAALTSLLVFFDAEPLLTKMWFAESLAVGKWALEHREGNVDALRRTIVAHHDSLAPTPADALLSTGVMAAVLGLIQSHVVSGNPEPLIVLLGPLIELTAKPLLDAESVSEQVERGKADARTLLAGDYPPPRPSSEEPLPELLNAPGAHRARQCMLYLSRNPGASNRQVADGIEVPRHGQVSTLLNRLYGLGLLNKAAGAPGHSNAWFLTMQGERAVLVMSST